MYALQQAAGNQATARWIEAGLRPVTPASAPLQVQRHSSWEHTLLGDTPPNRLRDAQVPAEVRVHLLEDLRARVLYFQADPTADPREKFPEVRWIPLMESRLWVSYGELNALADYLPDPSTIDTMARDELVPVLQKMRSGMTGDADNELLGDFSRGDADMLGMATHWMEYLSEAGGEVKALDAATAELGANRYSGLLSRNACHFAPFSWQRWAQYHNEAANEARKHFASRKTPTPLGDVPREAEEHARQALLKNGYGDHFLQDSFAAGHLVNKTLVMQWWVDFLNNMPVATLGRPGPEVLRRMGSASQRGIAGRHLYGNPPVDGSTNAEDRAIGTAATDPQSAQERTDRDRRVSGSGVTGTDEADLEANYQAYLELLNNAQAQGAAGAAHDYFNMIGLTVISADGTRMTVGGDDTLLSKSDAVGAEKAAQAAALSRQAIEELLNTGATAITVESLLTMVPTMVEVSAPPMITLAGTGQIAPGPMPLEQWQDDILRNLCFTSIFPDYFMSLKASVIGTFESEMVSGGMSQDSGKPPVPQLGDFPVPAGGSRVA